MLSSKPKIMLICGDCGHLRSSAVFRQIVIFLCACGDCIY